MSEGECPKDEVTEIPFLDDNLYDDYENNQNEKCYMQFECSDGTTCIDFTGMINLACRQLWNFKLWQMNFNI